MSRQANPTLIGTFVFVALIIAIGAVIILGNLQLQQSPVRCILYFTGSLYGLDKGAPVSLRGVQIGRVTDIRIDFNYQESNYTIPVSIEIDRETEEDTQAHPLFREKLLHQSLNELIGKGLRAQLKTSSLVTGKLYIDLGFYPETPVKLHEQETELLEIPTLPSDLEQLTQNLAELPLKELFTKTNQLLDWVNQALASEEIAESMEGMHHAILGIDELVTAMKRDAPALVQHADKGLDTLITLGTEATRLVHSVDRQLSPLGEASSANHCRRPPHFGGSQCNSPSTGGYG